MNSVLENKNSFNTNPNVLTACRNCGDWIDSLNSRSEPDTELVPSGKWDRNDSWTSLLLNIGIRF